MSAIGHNLTNREIRERNGGVAVLVNNIEYASADWFVGAKRGDLHLAKSVDAVHRAVKTTLDNATDIDCQPRNDSSGTDIGADKAPLSKAGFFPAEKPGVVSTFYRRWLSNS